MEWVFDGGDGAAKSPIIERVALKLATHGIATKVFAPFALVNEALQRSKAAELGVAWAELTPRQKLEADCYWFWQQPPPEPQRGLRLIKQAVQRARRSVKNGETILWDRHWLTVMLSVGSSAELRRLWGEDFPKTFVLQSPPAMVMSLRRYSPHVEWTSDRARILETNRNVRVCAREFRQHVVGSYRVLRRSQNLAPIVEDISAKILRMY